MVAKMVEARLVISGEDRASAEIAKVVKAFQDVEKSTKVSASIEKVTKALLDEERALKSVNVAISARSGVEKLQGDLQKTQAALAQTAASYDAARKSRSAFEGVKLAKGSEQAQQAAAAAKAVRDAGAAYRAAERDVRRTSATVAAQTATLAQAERAAAALGAPLASLDAHQRSLNSSVDRTTAALRQQIHVEEQAARVTAAHAREQAELTRHQRAHGVVRALATASSGAVGIHGVVRTIEHAAKAGAEVQSERVRLQAVNVPASERVHIEAESLRLAAQVRNVTQASIMELWKEMRSVMTDPHEVDHIIEPMVKAKSILDAQDKTGTASHGLNLLVKGAESIGAAKDPERFTHLLDGYVKSMQVMGKTITPESIYEMQKYSKAAGARWSDRFILTTAQSLGQEMGGSTAGNSIQMAQKQIVGGMQNLHSKAKEFARIGLIDPQNLDYLKTGEVKGTKAGVKHAVKGDDLAASDLDQWVYKILLPHMKGAGITAEGDQLAWVQKNFTSTAADVVSKIITQRESFQAHARMYEGASGLKGQGLNRDDAMASLGGLAKSIETFAGVVSSPVMKDAAHVLDSISGQIGRWSISLDEFNKRHPTLAKAEGPAAAAVGVAGAGAASALVWKALSGGFGLSSSASALNGSAALLDQAAIKLMGGKPVELAKDAAAAGGLTLGGVATGGVIASGALAGGWLDWNFGGNPGALGLLTGQESDAAKTARYVRERKEADALSERQALPPGWLRAAPKELPGGADARKGYATEYQVGGGVLHDFLWGKERQSMQLPGFGGERMLTVPAQEAGKAAGVKAGEAMRDGLAERAPQVVEQGRSILQRLQEAVSIGIHIPISLAPGEGLGGGGGGLIHRASFGGDGGGGGSFPTLRSGGPGEASTGGSGRLASLPTRRGGAPDYGGGAGGGGGSWYDSVMRAEGTAGKDPYNVVLGSGRYGLPSKPLTEMTLREAYAFGRQVRSRHGSSSALGAFQIVGRTMKSHMGGVGLGWDDKFSPENQRLLADSIRRKEGWGAWEGFKSHRGELGRARKSLQDGVPYKSPDPPGPKIPEGQPNPLDRQLPAGGGMGGAADRMHQAIDRLENVGWKSHHTVEVTAGDGLKARTKGMRATATGPVRADVGVSMPHTEGGDWI